MYFISFLHWSIWYLHIYIYIYFTRERSNPQKKTWWSSPPIHEPAWLATPSPETPKKAQAARFSKVFRRPRAFSRQSWSAKTSWVEILREETMEDWPWWFFAQVTLWLCQNSYWKWPSQNSGYFPMKHGDFPVRYVKLPEGTWEMWGKMNVGWWMVMLKVGRRQLHSRLSRKLETAWK